MHVVNYASTKLSVYLFCYQQTHFTSTQFFFSFSRLISVPIQLCLFHLLHFQLLSSRKIVQKKTIEYFPKGNKSILVRQTSNCSLRRNSVAKKRFFFCCVSESFVLILSCFLNNFHTHAKKKRNRESNS
jgi:hypothetical protein